MLGYLTGTILSKNPDASACTVLVQNLGYEVTVHKSLFERLMEGETASLWLHTHVREDILQLYGFESEPEKLFFRQLLNVSGLGPRTALSLLSEHGVHRLVQLIAHKATSDIATAAGVGKKLAERLVLELEGKMEKWLWLEKGAALPAEKKPELPAHLQLRSDLASALGNLGYAPNPIKVALDKVLAEASTSEVPPFEVCLKQALREMSSRQVYTDRSGHG